MALGLWIVLGLCRLCAQIEPLTSRPRFERLTIEDGLSHNVVNCMLQDSDGMMWFGTPDGLNRYDGYRFTIFRYDRNDEYSLSNNRINALFEDSRGDLWIGTDSGLNRYDRNSDRFVRFLHDPDNSDSLSAEAVFAIGEDSLGSLWIGAPGGGLNRMSMDRPGVFEVFLHDRQSKEPNYNWVRRLYLDQQNRFFIGANLGLYLLASGQSPPFQHFSAERLGGDSLRAILALHHDQRNALWIGVGGKLVRWAETENPTASSEKPEVALEGDAEIRDIVSDESGALWVATMGGGLLRRDPASDAWRRFMPDRTDPNSLSHPGIRALLIDRTGLLWIATDGGGVNKLNLPGLAFENYAIVDASDLAFQPSVMAIIQDRRNHLWLGTDRGLLHFDDRSKPLARYGRGALGDEWVWTLQEDRDGAIWVGTSIGGLTRLTPDGPEGERIRSFKHDPLDDRSLSYDGVSSIIEDPQGTLWVGTAGAGLNALDRANMRFTRYAASENDAESLLPDIVTALQLTQAGKLWIGTNAGVSVMDTQLPGIFATLSLDEPKESLNHSQNLVHCIFEADGGDLWIGCDGGLIRFATATANTTRYTTHDGLPNDTVFGVIEDRDGQIWLSTQSGLARLNPRTGVIQPFGAYDGVLAQEPNPGAYGLGRNGKMYFGHRKGFSAFFPDKIQIDASSPALAITDFKIFAQSVQPGVKGSPLNRAIQNTNAIQLSYKDRVFSFETAVLDYRAPAKNRFAFMLEGLEDQWTFRNADQRFAVYTNLDQGSYRFRVKGGNPYGVWSPETAIDIYIAPPLWKTVPAYVFYGLIVLSLIGLFWRLERKKLEAERALSESLEKRVAERTRELTDKHQEVLAHQRQLSEQAKQLRDHDALKTRFFTNISHEFRTPLTLTMGPLDDLLAEDDLDGRLREKLTMMQRSTRRLKKLIDELMDLSKLSAGQMALSLRCIDAAAFLRKWASPFHALADRNGVSFSIFVAEDGIAARLDPDKIETIVHNLLANAFRFTDRGGKIVVSLECPAEATLRISIKDTGAGIPPDQLPHVFDRFYQAEPSAKFGASSGVGLALARELAQLHGGDIQAASTPGFGSEFTLRLPRNLSGDEGEPAAPDEAAPTAADHPIQETAVAETPQQPSEVFPKDDARPLGLIIEDHPEVRAYLADILGSTFRVLQAKDGESGLAIALRLVPDLIISDVMMPGMDGFELCRKLKKDERASHVPIILLTAKASAESQIEGLETGADDYVAKPFHARALLQRAVNLVESRRRLRARFSQEMTLKPEDVYLGSADQAFLRRIKNILTENLADSRFGVYELAEEVGFSRRQLHRKISALTGQTPLQMIRRFRLERAAQLLKQKAGGVAEIAYAVGFNRPEYFSELFRKAFGLSPAEFAQRELGDAT